MDIKAFFNQLDSMFEQHRIEDVEPFLRRQMTLALGEEDHASFIAVSNELIGFLRSRRRHNESTLLAEETLTFCREHGFDGTPEYATTLLNGATAYRFAGNPEKALQMYSETEAIYRRNPSIDRYYYAGLYNNISAVYSDFGKTGSAADYLQKAAEILEAELPEHPEYRYDLTVTYANMCGLYRREGNRCEALRCIETACDTARGHASVAELYEQLLPIRDSLKNGSCGK